MHRTPFQQDHTTHRSAVFMFLHWKSILRLDTLFFLAIDILESTVTKGK
jgi:hypothetical protein